MEAPPPASRLQLLSAGTPIRPCPPGLESRTDDTVFFLLCSTLAAAAEGAGEQVYSLLSGAYPSQLGPFPSFMGAFRASCQCSASLLALWLRSCLGVPC